MNENETIDQPETGMTVMTTAELVKAKFTSVEKQMAELETENNKVVFDYADPKGNKAARSHVYKIKKGRSALEDTRKAEKQEALVYGRMVDSAAKELEARFNVMIAVHEEPLKRIEQEETDRKQAIQDAIDSMFRMTTDEIETPTAKQHAAAIAALEAHVIDPDVYQERMAEAAKTHAEYLERMRNGLATCQRRDAEQAELARLREEAAKREQADREAAIAAEASAKAKAQAEAEATDRQAKLEAKAQDERNAIAAKEKRDADARAKREAELEAAAQAEREASAKREADAKAATAAAERRAAEAEANAKAKVERDAQAKRDADEKRAANAKHVAKIVNEASFAMDVVIGQKVPNDNRDVSDTIIKAIRDGCIPHVTINF